jgi:hypothetical protein
VDKRAFLGFIRITILILFGLFGLMSLLIADSPLDPPPGTYFDTTILQLRDPSTQITARFLPGDFSPFDFTEPLILDALPGQRRVFTLELEQLRTGVLESLGTFTYVIDRSISQIPTPDPLPGVFFHPLELTIPDLPELRVSVNGQPRTVNRERGEPSLLLEGRLGQVLDYRVTLELGSGGARPSTLEAVYRVDRRQDQGTPDLLLLSPVSGRFLNPQLLYVQHSGFVRVLYSTNGSDPLEYGVLYQAPVELSGEGLELRVAGVLPNGEVIERSVSFSAGARDFPGVSQGTISQALEIPVLPSGGTFTTTERTPTRFDSTFNRPLRITPQANTLRSFTLRVQPSNQTNGEFRLFFLLEGRTAPQTHLTVQRTNPVGVVEFPNPASGVFPGDKLLVGSTPYRVELPSGTWTQVLETTTFHQIARGLAIDRVSSSYELIIRSILPGNRLGMAQRIQLLPDRVVQDGENLQVEPRTGGLGLFVPSPGLWYSFGTSPTGIIRGESIFSVPFGFFETGEIRFWTLLESGNAGDLITRVPFSLDNRLPPGPTITVDSRSVEITSELPVFYRIVSPNSNAPSITPEFQLYQGPFDLVGLDNQNIVYRIEAFAQVSDADRTTTSRTNDIFLNQVPVPSPRILGLTENSFVNQGTLELSLSQFAPGFTYTYEFFVDEQLVQQGEIANNLFALTIPQVEASGTIVIRAESRDTTTQIEPSISQIGINIDRIPPVPPRFVEPADGIRTNTSLTMVLENPNEDGSVVLFRFSNEPQEQVVIGPVVLDVPVNQTRLFEVIAQTQDAAGNRSEPVTRTFFIDKQPPEVPRVRLRTQDGEIPLPEDGRISINQDVEVILDSEYQIFIEQVIDQGTPPVPGVNSPRYTGPILVSAEPGTNRTLRFLSRSVDEVGNLSPLHRIIEIQVRKTVPSIPPEPVVIRDGNSGILEWRDSGQPIQYRFSGQQEFRTYTGPVTWTIPAGASEIVLFFQARDEAGNTSGLAELRIPRRNQTPRPLVDTPPPTGPTSVLPQLRLQPSRPGAELRFELGLNAQPQDVTAQSPLWTNDGLAEPLEGETIQYRLVVRQFEPGFEPSDPIELVFTVDRTPPLPPSSSIPDSLISFTPLTIDFTAEEGRILVRLDQSVYVSDSPPRIEVANLAEEPGDLSLYQFVDRSLVLPGVPGQVTSYLVYAIAQDVAGNTSDKARVWRVVVDLQNMFVDYQTRFPGNGSLAEPFSRLDQALELWRTSDRNRIFVAGGTHSLGSTLVVDKPLTIHGGFDQDWEFVEAETLLIPSSRFQGPSVINVGPSGRFGLFGMYLTDPTTVTQSLIRVRGGHLTGGQNLILASPGNVLLVHGDQGSQIDFSETQFLAYEGNSATKFLATGRSQVSITSSRFEFPQTPGFLRPASGLVSQFNGLQIEGSSLRVDDTHFEAPAGRVATTIYLLDSQSQITGSTLTVPRASDLGLAIHGIRSQLSLTGVNLQGNDSAASTVLIRLDGGSLNLRDGQYLAQGRLSATGIIAQDAEVRITGAQFNSGTARDFITLLQFARTLAVVEGTRVSSGWATGELIYAALESVTGTWRNNTLGLSNTQGQALGFHLIRSGSNDIMNNQINGTRRGTALYLADPDSQVQVRDNTFANWNTILVRNQPGTLNAMRGSSVFSDISALEASTEDGQIFSGNRVDQGL